jgi:hypothetical protein
MNQAHRAWSLTLGVLLGGHASCFHERRGVPIYPGGESPRPRNEVALLYGPIRFVDDARVTAKGDAFELMPGCHVVQIGGQAGSFDPLQQGGWITTLPPLTFAFRTAAGGTYAINVNVDPALGMGPNGTGHVVAREQDAHGNITVVPAARDRTAIDACRRWHLDGSAAGGG